MQLGNLKAARLNGNQLKLIAVVSMLLDHIGFLLVGDGIILPRLETGEPLGGWWILYCVLRMVGRIAFPIFCFLLVEGFVHTRDWKRYALRLAAFAAVSEIPFDLMSSLEAVYWGAQNVFFTLLLGLLMMKALETVEARMSQGSAGRLGGWKLQGAGIAILVVIVLFCGAAWLLRTDYDYIGIMLIALFYWFRTDRLRLCALGFVWMSVTMRVLYFIPGLALGFLMIYFYNGQRGKWKGKYAFYLFYPLHLMILYGIYHVVFK